MNDGSSNPALSRESIPVRGMNRLDIDSRDGSASPAERGIWGYDTRPEEVESVGSGRARNDWTEPFTVEHEGMASRRFGTRPPPPPPLSMGMGMTNTGTGIGMNTSMSSPMQHAFSARSGFGLAPLPRTASGTMSGQYQQQQSQDGYQTGLSAFSTRPHPTTISSSPMYPLSPDGARIYLTPPERNAPLPSNDSFHPSVPSDLANYQRPSYPLPSGTQQLSRESLMGLGNTSPLRSSGQGVGVPGPGPMSSKMKTLAAVASRAEFMTDLDMGSGAEIGGAGMGRICKGPIGVDGWSLSVIQQPERARLCSFKEENETMDRRPVDPPPVVQVHHTGLALESIVASSIQVRAVVVVATPSIAETSTGADPDPADYEERKLAQGAVATTGETVQGVDKLQDLSGRPGAFSVFGKLSVRVPGVFRLRFEMFETSSLNPSSEARILASCVSDLFEVFSPKQFKGMKESTLLTRHFASQGFKIKLRQDTGAGRGGRKRKAYDAGMQQPASSQQDIRGRTASFSSNVRPRLANGSSQEGPGPPSRSSSRASRIYQDGAGGNHGHHDGYAHAPASSRGSSVHRTRPEGHMTGGYQEGYGAGYQDGASASAGAHFHPSEDDGMDGEMDIQSGAPRAGGPGRGKVSLPSIGKALQQTSIWFDKAGAFDPEFSSDDQRYEAGGVVFQDGIRYGGDDGGAPPMTFGRLPSMISEGILPSTPGFGGTDLSSFSLKNNSVSLGTGFTPMVVNPSTPLPEFPYNLLGNTEMRSTSSSQPRRALKPSSAKVGPRGATPPAPAPAPAPAPSASAPSHPFPTKQNHELYQNPAPAAPAPRGNNDDRKSFLSAVSKGLEQQSFQLSLPDGQAGTGTGTAGARGERTGYNDENYDGHWDGVE